MPALSDTLRKDSPAGYAPAPVMALPPVGPPSQVNSFKVNPHIRSPLPPINAGPDTLRQFNDGDANVPRRRVLPLPTNNGMGGGSVVTNTTVIQAPVSGASSAALTAQTVAAVTVLLNSGSSSNQVLSMNSKS